MLGRRTQRMLLVMGDALGTASNGGTQNSCTGSSAAESMVSIGLAEHLLHTCTQYSVHVFIDAENSSSLKTANARP